MIKAIIIEDQEPAQRIIKRYLADIGDINLEATFKNAIDALNFLKVSTVDIIFLDIHLPKLSGMDFLSVLSQQPQVILTTAFEEYALKSYEFDVCDYLLKPFSFERFVKAVEKVKRNLGKGIKKQAQGIEKSIVIKNGYDFIKIDFDSILYIKSDGDYTQVHTTTDKYLVAYSLKYWKEHLPGSVFYQIHRSYIINTKQIVKTSSSKVYIATAGLPIGRYYKKDFLKGFEMR